MQIKINYIGPDEKEMVADFISFFDNNKRAYIRSEENASMQWLYVESIIRFDINGNIFQSLIISQSQCNKIQ